MSEKGSDPLELNPTS